MKPTTIDLAAVRRQLWGLLAPEGNFIWVVLIYGLAIGLLTLAVPIAVQTLINTIANIGSMRAVYILSATLFLLLMTSGFLSAMRMWVVERYERHVYCRLTGEMSYRITHAPAGWFDESGNTNLSNRYFEIMTLKRNLPRLMMDGFALALQMLVGCALVSFYHPWLFLFNLIVALILYLTWVIWVPGAQRTAIELSREKFYSAQGLHDLEVLAREPRDKHAIEQAAQDTENRTHIFIQSHARHFRYTFQQAVVLLLIYALGSASLLGLGGWLVNEGQLSIGQLVAAELVMTAVFLGLSRCVEFLKAYYELYGAADKISQLLSIPGKTVGAGEARDHV